MYLYLKNRYQNRYANVNTFLDICDNKWRAGERNKKYKWSRTEEK